MCMQLHRQDVWRKLKITILLLLYGCQVLERFKYRMGTDFYVILTDIVVLSCVVTTNNFVSNKQI